MISINEGSTALRPGMKVQHCRGSRDYYVVRVGEGLDLSRQALCVIRDRPNGIEAIVRCSDLTPRGTDPDAERCDITLDSLARHFDQRCDRLSIRAAGVDDHIRKQIPDAIHRLHARCNNLQEMIADLGMDAMLRRVTKTEEDIDRVVDLGANLEAREKAENESLQNLARKVDQWGVVFDELANRLAATERATLRLLNHVHPDFPAGHVIEEDGDHKWRQLEGFDGIEKGALIKDRESEVVYLVTANYGDRLAAVTTADATNPAEWSHYRYTAGRYSMDCGDCEHEWVGVSDSQCPKCNSTNTQPHAPEDQEM